MKYYIVFIKLHLKLLKKFPFAEGPNEVSFSRYSSKPEFFSNTSLSIYPANTTVTLTCNATVGSTPEAMQLCYLDGSEDSTGYVPFNISSITDSGVMASGTCNNRRLLSFEYHLETNDSATFLCMVGGNGTCVDGLLEETYTIRSGIILLRLTYNCSKMNFNLFIMNTDHYFAFNCWGL